MSGDREEWTARERDGRPWRDEGPGINDELGLM